VPRRLVPFEPPVTLPPGVHHGTAKAHQMPYRCRCVQCLTWRREYDVNRPRRDYEPRPKASPDAGWYVCADTYAVTYAEHEYDPADLCIRCRADRETEELWEARWKETGT
jgi:hypothetical protein